MEDRTKSRFVWVRKTEALHSRDYSYTRQMKTKCEQNICVNKFLKSKSRGCYSDDDKIFKIIAEASVFDAAKDLESST